MVDLSAVRQNLMDVANEPVAQRAIECFARSDQEAGPAASRSLRSDRVGENGFAGSASARDVDGAGSGLAERKRLCWVEDDQCNPDPLP